MNTFTIVSDFTSICVSETIDCQKKEAYLKNNLNCFKYDLLFPFFLLLFFYYFFFDRIPLYLNFYKKLYFFGQDMTINMNTISLPGILNSHCSVHIFKCTSMQLNTLNYLPFYPK